MLKKIEWLFFDVGSTLVNEQLAYEHRLNDIAYQAGLSFDQVYKTALMLYNQNQKGDLEIAKSLGVTLTKWHTEDERPYADAAQCLAALHKTYSIGIIANQLIGTQNRLAQYGLLPYIDLIISSAEEGVAKPNPEIFKRALNRSGCLAEHAVMIGDRIDNDILPAKQLGMHTIWIRQGFGQYWKIMSEAEKPDCEVQNLTEICNIL